MNAKLKKLLDANKVTYEIIAHRKVYTAWDEAQTQHLNPKEVAKAVVVKIAKDLVLSVLPAGKKVDLKKLAKLAGAKKIQMAKESDIAKRLKSKIGLLAPFGSLYKIPTYLDTSMTKNKKITLAAGSYTESLRLSVKDYLRMLAPVIGSFSAKK